MLANGFSVDSDKVRIEGTDLISEYDYQTNKVTVAQCGVVVTPVTKKIFFKTDTRVPKTGVMFIGLGGNNGSTVTSGLLANKFNLTWPTKKGDVTANFHGSLTQCSTTYLGEDDNGQIFVAAFKDLLPTVDPNDLVIGGWDISKANLYEAVKRAKVMEPTMYEQIRNELESIVPYPAIFDLGFVAPNQKDRADNILTGTKQQRLDAVRKHIKEFKQKNDLDKVIVFWTANTERYCEVKPEIHGSAEALLAAIQNNEPEISPSILYAVAAILEHCPFINGSAQNTLIPGVIELAEQERVGIMGDDLKKGQTKFKSVMADFLISSGLKLNSVASYNHLGNNNGLNLDFPKCLKSKEISKTSVIDDLVSNNPILYPEGAHPDHCVVIKYIPSVGDSKRALDEYDSGVFCGGENIISVHSSCEDSLLAAPLMIDTVLLMELFSRIQVKDETMKDYDYFASVYSVLSFLFKAPRTPNDSPVINSLFQQRAMLENTLRATRGLQPLNNMHLEWKMPKYQQEEVQQQVQQTAPPQNISVKTTKNLSSSSNRNVVKSNVTEPQRSAPLREEIQTEPPYGKNTKVYKAGYEPAAYCIEEPQERVICRKIIREVPTPSRIIYAEQPPRVYERVYYQNEMPSPNIKKGGSAYEADGKIYTEDFEMGGYYPPPTYYYVKK